MPETVEEIFEKPEVREELARTAGEKPRDAIVRYIGPPREAGRIKTHLIKNSLPPLTPPTRKSCFRPVQTGKFFSTFVRSVFFDQSSRVCAT
jgi:hypothetical protein